MKYKELINDANKFIKKNIYDINRLRAVGVKKQYAMGNKSSHIVVTYPPIHALNFFKGGSIFEGALDGLNTLYIHIPFCTGICTYCAYARMAAPARDVRISRYLDYLNQESKLLRSAFHNRQIPVKSIYIGGGTPTMLKEDQLELVLRIIARDFQWDKEVEFTLEGSPETVSVGKVALSKHFGVNRVSIGIESFNDKILEAIGRRHNAKRAYAALEQIKEGGINNIDFDLIRGLPNYTPEMIVEDIKAIKKADIPSVNSNQYSLKPLSLDAKKQPDTNIQKQLLMHTIFLVGMKKLGYRQKPIDWFVKEKKHLYKHQLLKWGRMANQLVLGLSSYGYINGIQFANFRKRTDYERSIKEGRLPIERATVLSEEELIRRRFIFGLKTRVNRTEFQRVHGVDPTESPFKDTLKTMIEAGAIEETDSSFTLSEVGMLFADSIQMAFYSDKIKSSGNA